MTVREDIPCPLITLTQSTSLMDVNVPLFVLHPLTENRLTIV